mmetsp:Transcript_7184/g.13739  ORF Transcript_7184/g.13739 Transcript_7184/m.13739 type:complete len:196 (-) Transcript_7184:109-696(-)|eukprot:scaffold10095_cov163-Amphora_coffeaeformis.AAC.11
MGNQREYIATRTGSGLIHALNEISVELKAKYDALPDDFLLIVLLDFVVPAVLALLLCGLGLYTLRAIIRFIFPPSAQSLHEEALVKLNKGQEKQAEKLLRQAVARSNSTYSPAVLSLAALFCYRREEPKKAIEVLDSANEATSRKQSAEPKSFTAVRRDAEAILSGNRNMVLIPVAETEYLTTMTAVARHTAFRG